MFSAKILLPIHIYTLFSRNITAGGHFFDFIAIF